MKIIAVDDERLALENILNLLKKTQPSAEISGFIRSSEAFAFLEKHKCDIAFLDIEMSGMNGLTLAKKCKELCPEINIVFVTGHEQYTLDALRLRASGYIFKPVRENDLKAELENLRHPIADDFTHKVRIQAFGNFEIFVDQKPLSMPIAKCKECIAYLVDRRGARVTAAELAAVLWEDCPYDKRIQNNIYRVISDTVKYLKDAGISDIIIKSRKDMAINIANVDCDYYRFLKGDVSQINMFRGEYMTNYSWAEFTLAELYSAGK